MAKVTFQILEGIDKGRVFRDLATPVTIGREEGNLLRLNDERVSRFHAKVQIDNEDFILTDLESTNGTKVNGTVVQIRRLRHGDRVSVGRSLLLFGSNEEIRQRMLALETQGPISADLGQAMQADGPATIQAGTMASPVEGAFDFDLNVKDPVTATPDALFIGNHPLPPLPQKLTPSQAARLAEILDFLHQGLTVATENIQAREDGTQVSLGFADWQKVLAVQMLLSRYLRAVAEPDALDS
ncbi:MAG: FHA domain-containing protein [Planctomycetes bacterium]|nr:FHA domain-containing protein [Planctomycetota bacterium]